MGQGCGLCCELFCYSPCVHSAKSGHKTCGGQSRRSVTMGGGLAGQLTAACQHCVWLAVR